MATEKELKEREAEIEKREKSIADKEATLAQKKGETIPAKYLEGLMFSDATHEEVFDKKLNRKKTVHTPFERKLKPADVMAWRDAGDAVIIATKDGKKHEVKK
jgi:hypothetical protein